MKTLLRAWILDVVSLLFIDWAFAGIAFNSTWTLVLTALALAVLSCTVKPLLQVIAIPVTVLTLGIFNLIINAVILELAFHLVSGAYLASFTEAFLASIVLSIVNSILSSATKD